MKDTFKLFKDGFQFMDRNEKTCVVLAQNILKVSAFTLDHITFDELVLKFNLTNGNSYIFSEEIEGWSSLLKWVKIFAGLQENWLKQAFPKPFDTEIHILYNKLIFT